MKDITREEVEDEGIVKLMVGVQQPAKEGVVKSAPNYQEYEASFRDQAGGDKEDVINFCGYFKQ